VIVTEEKAVPAPPDEMLDAAAAVSLARNG